MFEQVREQVLGIVENMSYLEHNGEKLYIFGKGGGARTAEKMNVPLLAEIPLDPATRAGGDAGKPIATLGTGNKQARLFEDLARKIVEVAAESVKQKQRPTITIAD
jgi:ATP-binding protein involved in chromosome partitioning